MDDSAYYAEIARYALGYPGIIVAPLGVLAVVRPGIGLVLLIVTALAGAALFTVFGGDTRSEQVTTTRDGRSGSHFERDAPENVGSGLTGSLSTFGLGLFVLAGLAFVLVVVFQ